MVIEQLAKEDYMDLRQEASELQEYSNAKLFRATRYLGVLADKTRRLGEEFNFSASSINNSFEGYYVGCHVIFEIKSW